MEMQSLMYEQHAHAIHSRIINNEIVMFMNLLFSIHLLFPAASAEVNMLMRKYDILNESFSLDCSFLLLALLNASFDVWI